MRTKADGANNDAVRVAAQTAGAPWQGIAAAAARRFHQVCAARVAMVVGEHGLTPLQYAALLHLSWNAEDAGLEQNVLGTRLNIDRNTASVVVEQLVKLGLTARRVNGADRRSRLLSLTAKGKKLYGRLAPIVDRANAELLAPLSPRERRQFMGLLIRAIEGNVSRQESPPRRRRRNVSRIQVDNA